MEKTKTTYKSFEEARRFVRKLNLKSEVQWKEYAGNKLKGYYKIPYDIPTKPEQVYKNQGWIDFSDWIGVEYLDFTTARSIVHQYQFDSLQEWKSSFHLFLPNTINIPFDAENIYQSDGWISWNDWLGIGKVVAIDVKNHTDLELHFADTTNYSEYEITTLSNRNFNKAREFVRKLGISSRLEWEQYVAGMLPSKGYKPRDIPARPDLTYKKGGWKGWFYWFGFEMISFEEARKFSRRLNFRQKQDWYDYINGVKNSHIPKNFDIPDEPSLYYKDEGWAGWNDWLGVEEHPTDYEFQTLREFARTLGLKNSIEWQRNIKELRNNLALEIKNMPNRPDIIFKDKGWNGWKDWLGIENNFRWRNFNEARNFARSLNLNGKTEWMDYVRGRKTVSTPLPDDIPKDPSQRYKDKGWLGWTDWVKEVKTK